MLDRRSALSTTADVAIVVLALAVVTQVGFQIRDRLQPPRQPAPRAATPPPDYLPGDKLPEGVDVTLEKADYTLLMFLSSTCGYCTASMPFYGKLSEARSNSSVPVRLTAVSGEPREVLVDYLAQHNVAVDAMVGLSSNDFRRMKVRGTPTLILATREGVIRKVWIGRLGPEQEAEVLATFEGRSASD